MPHSSLTVCLMNDSFPPAIDGVANAVVNYARIIDSELGRTIVAVPDYPNVVDDYSFPVVRYPSVDTTRIVGYRAGNPFSARTVAALADAGPDIIHSHCPAMSTAMARILREQIDVPMVFTYHTKFDIELSRTGLADRVQKGALRLLVDNVAACDEVWVVSRGAGENLRGLGYQGDYMVMENGVDFPRGRVTEETARALREELDLPQDVPVYLFVGRMMWYKGIRLLMDALARLKADGRDFRMVMVGDGLERDEMEDYVEQLGLTDRVLFAGTVLDRERLRAFYCMADLFLFPSTFDTNGIVVREAAACGLGSVLIKDSCAAEDLTDGENALMIEENADSLYALLDRTGFDRPALHALGQRAMDQLYLSWEDAVKRAYERYGVVLDNYKRGLSDRNLEWSDEVYNLMSDLCRGIRRVRGFRGAIYQKIRR
ncbi:MAG: glycosyltransferase family 4 protein [Oscillospiraceae bacterium]|nr:glycosyltransferase family 4 protein [Oscillospiraceae bacterium]MCI8878006.1 glycosyltransferase family 4 protein [Oscillospiraceae bacterium]